MPVIGFLNGASPKEYELYVVGFLHRSDPRGFLTSIGARCRTGHERTSVAGFRIEGRGALRTFPELPANQTCRGHYRIDAIDP
jgi:hypothetical protein